MIKIERVCTVTIEHPDISALTVGNPDESGCVFVKQDNDTVMLDKDLALALITVLQEMFK